MKRGFISLLAVKVMLIIIAMPLTLGAQSGNDRTRVVTGVISSDSAGKVTIRSHTDQQRNFSFQSRSHPRITWDFSRILSEQSIERDYSFEVEECVKQFTINISGSCRSGSVTIEILMPGNKSYAEVTIDEYGNLNWRKSFQINDETKDRIGVWKFKVTSRSATGSFRLNIQAY